MKHTLIVRPEAEADLADAVRWYDLQRPGLGAEFQLCVEEKLERIRRTPEMHAMVYRELRRASVRRFPYAILYRVVEKKKVIVVAVMHSRRDPKRWQDRA